MNIGSFQLCLRICDGSVERLIACRELLEGVDLLHQGHGAGVDIRLLACIQLVLPQHFFLSGVHLDLQCGKLLRIIVGCVELLKRIDGGLHGCIVRKLDHTGNGGVQFACSLVDRGLIADIPACGGNVLRSLILLAKSGHRGDRVGVVRLLIIENRFCGVFRSVKIRVVGSLILQRIDCPLKSVRIAVDDGLRVNNITGHLLRVGKSSGHVGPSGLRVIVRMGCSRVGGADGGIQSALVKDGDSERNVVG